MANLTSTTITGNANVTAEVNAATFAGDAGKTSNLAAGNIASGTLSTDRLPTVPTSKGGTGLTTLGSAGEVLKVTAPGTGLEFGEAGGGGNYVRRVYTSPATWTKPTGVQAVKVEVWGGGGCGGKGILLPNFSRVGGHGGSGGWSSEYIPEASIPGPVSVTVGGESGTSSYGAFLSATGGGTGGNAPGNAEGNPGSDGTGSGGDINIPGNYYRSPSSATGTYGFGCGGNPGPDAFGPAAPGNPAQGRQQGGGGGGGNCGNGGNGAPGLVIVEEYY